MNRTTFVITAAIVIGLAGTGGAVAANTIGSTDIKNNSILSRDIHDNGGVGWIDLSPYAKAKATQGPKVVDFTANGDSEVTPEAIVLRGDNTSAEAENTGIAVETGDIISFDVTLADGAVCGGGSPRMYVKIGDAPGNSFDAGDGCDGTVLYTAPSSGTINSLYFVHDNASGGTVYVDDVKIDGETINFK